MLNNDDARGFIAPVVNPVARTLLRLGVTPDMVTLFGTTATVVGAMVFFPQGEFLTGVLVILLVILSDLLDGTMARMSGKASPWGAWLDSTLDRVGDGAVFGGLLIWAAWNHMGWTTAMAWICVVGGAVISYAKARAESVGAHANVGIAERAERLIIGLGAALLQGWGVSNAIEVGLTILAVLTLITIGQRAAVVRQQLRPGPDAAGPDTPGGATGTPAP